MWLLRTARALQRHDLHSEVEALAKELGFSETARAVPLVQNDKELQGGDNEGEGERVGAYVAALGETSDAALLTQSCTDGAVTHHTVDHEMADRFVTTSEAAQLTVKGALVSMTKSTISKKKNPSIVHVPP